MRASRIFLAVAILWAAPAWSGSQSFDWLVDQVPEIPVGGVHTLLIQSWVPSGHPAADRGIATQDLVRTGLRALYGITDNVALMYQLNLAYPNGQSYQYEGSEFGSHFRLYEGHGWKLGGAVELEWQRAPQFVEDALGIDFHPIIERDLGPVSLVIDPMLEKSLVGPDASRGVEAGYAAQVLYHWSTRLAAGVEMYGSQGRVLHGGSVSNQDHYIMPVVNADFSSVSLSMGPGFGLTAAADHVVFKCNLRYALPERLFPADLLTR